MIDERVDRNYSGLNLMQKIVLEIYLADRNHPYPIRLDGKIVGIDIFPNDDAIDFLIIPGHDYISTADFFNAHKRRKNNDNKDSGTKEAKIALDVFNPASFITGGDE